MNCETLYKLNVYARKKVYKIFRDKTIINSSNYSNNMELACQYGYRLCEKNKLKSGEMVYWSRIRNALIHTFNFDLKSLQYIEKKFKGEI